MDTEHVPTAEELAAEQAALVPSKEEEVKVKVMEDFGFDDSTDPALVDKAVKKEMAHRDALSKTIAQKIKHRTAADELRKNGGKPASTEAPKGATTEDVDKAVDEKLATRDLNALEMSDDLKKEVKRIAQIQNVDILTASRDPYIVAKQEQEKRDAKNEEATISRKNKTSGKKVLSIDSPPEVDMTTPEGRKEWDEWKAEMAKQGH